MEKAFAIMLKVWGTMVQPGSDVNTACQKDHSSWGTEGEVKYETTALILSKAGEGRGMQGMLMQQNQLVTI